MNNDELLEKLGRVIDQKLEPINKKLDGLEHGVKEQGTAIREQGKIIAQIKTGVEALAAGQQDLRERTATKKDVDTAVEVAEKELRADILLIDAKLVKTVHSHGKRIENIEQHEGIQNPDKN